MKEKIMGSSRENGGDKLGPSTMEKMIVEIRPIRMISDKDNPRKKFITLFPQLSSWALRARHERRKEAKAGYTLPPLPAPADPSTLGRLC